MNAVRGSAASFLSSKLYRAAKGTNVVAPRAEETSSAVFDICYGFGSSNLVL